MTAERMSAEELERLRVETAQFIDNGDFACDATLVQELTCDIASLLAHIAALQREAEAERARADAMREAVGNAIELIRALKPELACFRLEQALSQARGEPSLSSANPE